MTSDALQTPPLEALTTLGHWYAVESLIGEGAAAWVLRVRDARNDAVRAAKVLKPESVKREEVVRRFEDEYRILRHLHHPSVPEVYDYGWTTGDLRYMVMELVEGETLDSYFAKRPTDLWMLLYELCEALTFIHSHNLLHLDIKPENILVKRTSAFGDEMPMVMLMDFGLTYRRDGDQDAAMVGTPDYMAPEVIRGETPFTSAVDHYSLGATLYELLAGRPPFSGSQSEVLKAHLKQRPEFERERVEWAELYPHVIELLSKDKKDRLDAFQSFWRAVVGRVSGALEDLDETYAASHIRSLDWIGKQDVWQRLTSRVLNRAESEDALQVTLLEGEPSSGRTYCVDRLEDELKVKGTPALRLDGERRDYERIAAYESDDHIGIHSAKDTGVLHARVYDALCHGTRSGRIAILVDSAAELPPEERDFVSFAVRRSNTVEEKVETPVDIVIAGDRDETASLLNDRRPKENSLITIAPLDPVDHAAVSETFRGRMFSATDARNLAEFVSASGSNAGILLDHLLAAVSSGALARRRGRWQIDLIKAGAIRGSQRYASQATSLERLAPEDLDVLDCLVCAGTPVRVSTIANVFDRETRGILVSIERLERFYLVRTRRTSNSTDVFIASTGLRDYLGERQSPDRRNEIARNLLPAFGSALASDTLTRDEQLRLLLASCRLHFDVGESRNGARQHLRAVAIARTSGDDDLIRVCEDGIRLIRSMGLQVGLELYTRYLTKLLLAVYRKRYDLEAIKRLLGPQYLEHGIPIPASFVPKALAAYASMRGRDAMDIINPALTHAIDALGPTSIPALRLQISAGQYYREMDDYESAFRHLDHVQLHADRLDTEDRVRLSMTYVNLFDETGDYVRFEKILDELEPWLLEAGLVNDYCIVQQARCSRLLGESKLREGLSVARRALKVARRAGLQYQISSFYFWASAFYFELAEFERALKYLTKATQVRERVGLTHQVADALVRYGMIYQQLGRYGNAARYLRRAMKTVSAGPAVALSRISFLECCLAVGAPESHDAVEDLKAAMEGNDHMLQNAYFNKVVGDYHQWLGDYEQADSHYHEALDGYERVNEKDDVTRTLIRILMPRAAKQPDVDQSAEWKIVQKNVSEMESLMIVGEFAQLELARLEGLGDLSELREWGRECERIRVGVRDCTTQLNMDRKLVRLWKQIGDQERATEAFERFLDNTRQVIANLDDPRWVESFNVVNRTQEIVDVYKATGATE